MRKHFLVIILLAAFTASAQTARGIRIGYIDMEYILQNVPDYLEAKNQLELKAQKWKQEAEVKKNDITKLKESLKTERVLLTKELIEEREEEIAFQESELSDFQQKRFGPTGDLNTQKAVLVKPIQDQIFTAVQDIAEVRKYDFIFDKSSDLTMLFAAKRYDISDQVIRALNRASKRNQLSKKELEQEAKQEYEENLQDENPAMAERQRKLDERKAAREKLIADRKAAADQKREEAAAKRQQAIDDREGRKTGAETPSKDGDAPAEQASKPGTPAPAVKERPAPDTSKRDSVAAARERLRLEALEKRANTQAERKKELEEKKAKVLAEREAAKKAKEEEKNTQPATKPEDEKQ